VALTEVVADHLEEETTLGIYADGASRGGATNSNEFGTVKLDGSYSQVLCGYRYNSALTTVPMDWAAQGRATALGTALGKMQKIAKVDIHLYETGNGLTVGIGSVSEAPDHMDPIETLDLDTATDTAPGLVSTWAHIPVGGVYGDEPVLYFEVEDPIPFTILEYSARGNVNEN
jgi:hypothetical protein